MRAATRLQSIRDGWNGERIPLLDALEFNRRIWTLLMAAMSEQDCPLDRQLRSNIFNLGVFVLKRTLLVMADEKMEMLDILISINREIAAGLRGRAADQPALAGAAG